MSIPNYYEFLQISPNAEPETVHRVYRFLAARFHPDNPHTGDLEKFQVLNDAYQVLADARTRARYDEARRVHEDNNPDPLSNSMDFMDDIEGEMNRRLAIVALLYMQRRNSPYDPGVSLMQVEERMGCPREYLEFTVWYLQKKGYITRSDNSSFSLTADGVDFVETQRARLPVLHKLLTTGTTAVYAAA